MAARPERRRQAKAKRTLFMKCLHPLQVKYYPNMSRKQFYEKYPNAQYYKIVPCGRCVECQKRLRNNWSFRLLQQMEVSSNNFFITLTYDDTCIPTSELGYVSLRKQHLEHFLKKFRNYVQREYVKQLTGDYKSRRQYRSKMKYFAIGDYGDKTFRPHYHAIIFDCPITIDKLYNYISDNWNYGQVNQVDRLIPQQCNYITRYLVKVAYYEEQFAQFGIEPTFRLMSRGLGMSFCDDVHEYEFFELGRKVFHKGTAQYGIPHYLKRKIVKNRLGNDAAVKRYFRNEYNKYIIEDKNSGYPQFINDYRNQLNQNVEQSDYINIKRQRK